MKKNQIKLKVTGRYALFTDPMTKIGGEKTSLAIPPAEVLKGVVSSVYWKPSLLWYIDEVEILNQIRTERKGMRPIKYDGGNDLSYYTYLTDVSYIITAHFEFNQNRTDLKDDFNENKHYFIAKRCIAKGGRRDVFLGTRECQAYVEEVTGEEESFYKDSGEIQFGLMYHSLCYPDQNGKEELEALFWNPKMVNGVIRFCTPEECEYRITLKKMKKKEFVFGKNFWGIKEKEILDGYRNE